MKIPCLLDKAGYFFAYLVYHRKIQLKIRKSGQLLGIIQRFVAFIPTSKSKWFLPELFDTTLHHNQTRLFSAKDCILFFHLFYLVIYNFRNCIKLNFIKIIYIFLYFIIRQFHKSIILRINPLFLKIMYVRRLVR